MNCRRFGVIGAIFLGVVWGGEVTARAEPAPGPSQVEVRAARQLFVEGERDEAAGRWREALDKFTHVVVFKETPSGLFHKAYCEEKLGLLFAAYRDYKRAAELNEKFAAGNAENKKLIDREATSHMAALLPRIPSLKLRAPVGVAGMSVLLDDVALGPGELNVSRQVETGQHIVEATAPGRLPFRGHIALAEGASETMNIVFAEPAAAPALPGPRVQAPTVDERPSSGRAVAVWAGVGASAALAATGVAFFLQGRSASNELERECSRADALCRRDEHESDRDRNYLVAGVAGGLAAAGAGVTVWLGLSSNAKPATSRQALTISPRGLTFRSSF